MFVEQKSMSMAKNCYRIHNAAYFGDIELLKCLLTDRHYANSRNQKGNTPLASTLVGKGTAKVKLVILELLLRKGAEINYVNDDEDSILHVAVRAAFHQKISNKIIKWLINNGADKTLVNKHNLTACQLAFQVNNSKLGTFLLFYEKPGSSPDENPSYSKKTANGHLLYTQTITQTRTKSPGVVRSLIEFMYPLCVSKYAQKDITAMQGNKPFPLIDGKPSERKRMRRYYEDIDISSDENLATHDELIRNGYENIFEHLHLNRNEEGNFILHLNDGNNSSDSRRTVVITTSSDETFEVSDKEHNCSDT